MHTKSVRTFLTAGMDSLMPQAKRLIELRQILAQALPNNLRRSCSIANYKQGKVVIFAENSAVAAKLKLLLPAVRDHFLKFAVEVTGIEVQVQPAASGPAAPISAIYLSENAAESLRRLSKQLPDSKLKEAIEALAKNARSKH